VAFIIMPVFALANAGVVISLGTFGAPLAMAIGLGLVVGKPLGICLAVLLVSKLKWARLPEGTTWGMMIGGGCLAGIGFTMALFVASLGLKGELLEEAKGGVLLGSAVSIVLGAGLLFWLLPKPAGKTATMNTPSPTS